MTIYLKATGRALAVVTASLGWLIIVPFVDLISRPNDRVSDRRAENRICLADARRSRLAQARACADADVG